MNLLRDPLFTVVVAGERVFRSLPTLLADLLTGSNIRTYPFVSAEQHSYWLRFQVRCAARALRTAGSGVAEAAAMSAGELATRLEAALLEHSAATDWDLYQADPSLPGFLQPPTPNAAPPAADGYRADDCGLLTQIIGTRVTNARWRSAGGWGRSSRSTRCSSTSLASSSVVVGTTRASSRVRARGRAAARRSWAHGSAARRVPPFCTTSASCSVGGSRRLRPSRVLCGRSGASRGTAFRSFLRCG